MVITRGELWWADLERPQGSEPGSHRPVLVVSADSYNTSRLRTVILAIVTSAPRAGRQPGNIALATNVSELPRESTVNVTQLVTAERGRLEERIATLPDWLMAQVDDGLRLALSLR